MADLRTEQQITKELDKQYEKAQKINLTTKEGRALKKEIIKLEKELEIAQARGAKKGNDQQQDIQKLIDARVKKEKSLVGMADKVSVLTSKASEASRTTLGLLKQEAGVKGGLTEEMKAQLEVTDNLNLGNNDAAGIAAQMVQSAERMSTLKAKEKSLQDQLEAAKKSGDESAQSSLESDIKRNEKAKDIEGSVSKDLKTRKGILQVQARAGQGQKIFNQLAEASKGKFSKINDSAKGLGKGMKLARVGAAGFAVVLALVVKAIKSFSDKVDMVGKTFGFITNTNKEFRNDLILAGSAVGMIGKNLGDVLSVTSQLASDFGITLTEADDLAVKILDTAVATGISNDEATKLFGTFMQLGDLTAQQAEKLIENTAQLAEQRGVAPTAVLRDMANSSEEIAKFTQGSGENIAKAAVQARQLGLSLSTTARIAEGLLDFETSIRGEIEASVMIGKQLNFQRARQLALEGNIEGAVKNVVNQLGGEEKFNKLNVIQRQSIAKSLNSDVATITKLIRGQEKLTLATALSGETFDDLIGQDSLSTLTTIVNTVKTVSATLLDMFGQLLVDRMAPLKEFVTGPDGIKNIKGVLISVINAFIKAGNVAKDFLNVFRFGDDEYEMTALLSADKDLKQFDQMARNYTPPGGRTTQSQGGMTDEQAKLLGMTIASQISLDTKITNGQLNLTLDGPLGG